MKIRNPKTLLIAALLIAGCTVDSGSSGPSGSGNSLVDFGSAFMPNGTGGYVQAGFKALSSFTLTEADEDAMGRSVTISLTNTYPVVHDTALNDYVAMVGYTVSEATSRADLYFVFAVLDTDQVGAYSGPNGYVMIMRGAIAHMRDESELAGVLGHEIAHVCHEDGLNAVRTARQTDAAAQALSTALSKNDNAGAYDFASDIVLDAVFKKGYDRKQELNADHDAVIYIAAAGYDPAGYQRFVDRIATEQGRGDTQLFATHPGFNERKEIVAKAVDKTGRAGTGATNADRFAARTASLTRAAS